MRQQAAPSVPGRWGELPPPHAGLPAGTRRRPAGNQPWCSRTAQPLKAFHESQKDTLSIRCCYCFASAALTTLRLITSLPSSESGTKNDQGSSCSRSMKALWAASLDQTILYQCTVLLNKPKDTPPQRRSQEGFLSPVPALRGLWLRVEGTSRVTLSNPGSSRAT